MVRRERGLPKRAGRPRRARIPDRLMAESRPSAGRSSPGSDGVPADGAVRSLQQHEGRRSDPPARADRCTDRRLPRDPPGRGWQRPARSPDHDPRAALTGLRRRALRQPRAAHLRVQEHLLRPALSLTASLARGQAQHLALDDVPRAHRRRRLRGLRAAPRRSRRARGEQAGPRSHIHPRAGARRVPPARDRASAARGQPRDDPVGHQRAARQQADRARGSRPERSMATSVDHLPAAARR
jgi:hypothetical protein